MCSSCRGCAIQEPGVRVIGGDMKYRSQVLEFGGGVMCNKELEWMGLYRSDIVTLGPMVYYGAVQRPYSNIGPMVYYGVVWRPYSNIGPMVFYGAVWRPYSNVGANGILWGCMEAI